MAYTESSAFLGVGDGVVVASQRVVVGFTEATPFSPPPRANGHCTAQRARSLLSDLLHAEGMAYERHFCDEIEDEDEDAYSSTSEGGEDALSLEELYLESSICDRSDSRSETSSISSQPITIPSTTYFKAEDQKAALYKLNAKRKWWASQQHPPSLVLDKPAQLAAQKHHYYHKQQHNARGNHIKQP